eukprot:gene6893-30870_t
MGRAASGALEREVRRKADPAKESIRDFVAKWSGNPRVRNHPSHDEILAAITTLGAFYRKNGSRTRMDAETAAAISVHLDAAEASLVADGNQAPSLADRLRTLKANTAEQEDKSLLDLF